jgi:hypothetical protein
MGNPEASISLTTSDRLGGHPAGSPRDVLDQSLARISADMLDVTGMSVSVCRAIDLAKGMFPPVTFQANLSNKSPMADKDLNALFLDKIYKALPKMAKAANSDQLRAAFEKHHDETEGQIERLEQIFEQIGIACTRKEV